MLGAMLRQELLLCGRRNRLHVFRWAYASWLVAVVVFMYFRFSGEQLARRETLLSAAKRFGEVVHLELPPVSAPAVVGRRFVEAFVVQQLFLLLLATPAFVAGAITDEKRRGTLQQLLTTGVEARHILVGKLLGRMAQVLLLACAGLPPFALLAGFGGIGPAPVALLAAALLPPLFALAAASVLASVLCRQTRDAILALYVSTLAAGMATWRLGGILEYLNPLYVLAPAWELGEGSGLAEAGSRLALSALAYAVLGGACLAMAVWRLWPAFRRELEGDRPSPQGGRWLSGPRASLGDDPVLWRECHVEGLAPAPAFRRFRRGVAIAAIAATVTASSLAILIVSLPSGVEPAELARALVSLNTDALSAAQPDASVGFLVQSLVVLLLASLVVGVRCSGAVTGERERQTWEALLLTPLSARQILHGKLWGILGASFWYLLAYAAPAVVLSTLGGLLALFWTVLWLGVTLLAMYYVGAAGLWCSVRSRNSWRALLGTLTAGYIGGVCMYLLTTPIWGIIGLILAQALKAIDRTWGTKTAAVLPPSLAAYETPFLIASSVGLVLIFWFMSRSFFNRALRWVADRERTRHWHEEPVYRRTRRPLRPIRSGG
jgi:ABC-type transport system involved in multi-copper enzyme maturation permease subunit